LYHRNVVVVSQPPQTQEPKPQPSRPTSILYCFIRSLAQSVSLPQEDPSIYQEWQQQHHQYQNAPCNQQHQPTLATSIATITGDSSSSIPRLYNVEILSSKAKVMLTIQYLEAIPSSEYLFLVCIILPMIDTICRWVEMARNNTPISIFITVTIMKLCPG
jgi:hypothetical protein